MFSGYLYNWYPQPTQENPMIDTQPMSADNGDSAGFDTPTDIGWDRNVRLKHNSEIKDPIIEYNRYI